MYEKTILSAAITVTSWSKHVFSDVCKNVLFKLLSFPTP